MCTSFQTIYECVSSSIQDEQDPLKSEKHDSKLISAVKQACQGPMFTSKPALRLLFHSGAPSYHPTLVVFNAAQAAIRH